MCESQDAHVEKRRLPEEMSSCPWADRLAGQMDRLSRELLALQEQLQQLVAQRKAAWGQKVRQGSGCTHEHWRALGACIFQLFALGQPPCATLAAELC